jgi:hypothetical protein
MASLRHRDQRTDGHSHDGQAGPQAVDVEVLPAGSDAHPGAGDVSAVLLEAGARAALHLPRDVRPARGAPDAGRSEAAVGLTLVVLCIVPGVLPWLLLATTEPAVQHLLAVDRGFV